jgi:hypothetical protein
VDKEIRQVYITRKSQIYFSIQLTAALIGLILGMIFYGEKFLFWEYPFSSLGATRTIHGFDNNVSRCIFDSSMALSGIMLLLISKNIRYSREKVVHSSQKEMLCLIGGIGFIIMLYPHNINNFIHSIGSGFAVGSLWLLSIIYLHELQETKLKSMAGPLRILLQGTLLPYALTFFLNMSIKQYCQKFAVFGVIFVLRAATQLCRKESVIQIKKTSVPDIKVNS